jgi:hypothetical protein
VGEQCVPGWYSDHQTVTPDGLGNYVVADVKLLSIRLGNRGQGVPDWQVVPVNHK